MRQGVVLPETPRQRLGREGLEQDLIDGPLTWKPLRRRYRNFSSDAGAYLASLGGPRPYMTRLREIAALVEQYEHELSQEYETLPAEAWSAHVERLDFSDVNELIHRHNRWFPIEARLSMDPRTGDFALVNGERYAKDPLDARWVLDRFPARAA